MKTIKLKDFPTLRAQVKKWCPNYRKHSVMISVSKSVQPFGWWWDGGSKSDYATGRIGGYGTTPWNSPVYPGKTVRPIPVGGQTVVVETGIFQGKPATMSLSIHPNDLGTLGLTAEDIN